MAHITMTQQLNAIKHQADAISKFEEPRCSRRELKINTADHAELRHVIFPKTEINIRYCSGSCHGETDIRRQILPKLSDKIRQKNKKFNPEEACCVPSSYGKQSFIFKNILDAVIIDDLVVESCHCVPKF